jgi:hypothetical protein
MASDWDSVLRRRLVELEARLLELDSELATANANLDALRPDWRSKSDSMLKKDALEWSHVLGIREKEAERKSLFDEWLLLEQAIDRRRGHRVRIWTLVLAIVGITLGLLNGGVNVEKWRRERAAERGESQPIDAGSTTGATPDSGSSISGKP